MLNQDYYKIDLNDIINNLEPEEIQVLDYINDLNTDSFNGVSIEDMLEANEIIALDIKKTKLRLILERFRLINAIGIKMSQKTYFYYMKENGRKILELLSQNY